MFDLLKHPVFARLFSAQVIALIGTGLLTVALGLLAYDLAEEMAGAVLGAALTIKMVAYVGLAPVVQAFAQHVPRKWVLVGADVVRGVIALSLPFVTEIWQIYVLIFVLQAASATFTPAFQATIPDVLTDEAQYTRALSLSRLAYDVENLASPVIAGLLLTVVSYNWLFMGTVLGFAASAVLILGAVLPPQAPSKERPFRERLTRGVRIYLATPRLRGLLALNLLAAASSGYVFVNTVVVVRGVFGGSESDLAIALAAFGAGSMVMALMLPRLLETKSDRPVMLYGGLGLGLLSLALGFGLTANMSWAVFLIGWAGLGLLYSSILTPAGRLLRRSAHAEDRPSIFAAQFALSHACYLICYPLAGWVGVVLGLGASLMLMGTIGLLSAIAAMRLWPADSGGEIAHSHPDLPPDHPHLRAHEAKATHVHDFVIDDEHRAWPARG